MEKEAIYLEHPYLMERYQLDVTTIPIDLKSMMEETQKAFSDYEKFPTLANKKKVILNDTALCQALNDWVDEVCGMLEE